MRKGIQNFITIASLVGSLSFSGCVSNYVKPYDHRKTNLPGNVALKNIESALDSFATCVGGNEVTSDYMVCTDRNSSNFHNQVYKHDNVIRWDFVNEIFMEPGRISPGELSYSGSGCSVGMTLGSGTKTKDIWFRDCNTAVSFIEAVVSYTNARHVVK